MICHVTQHTDTRGYPPCPERISKAVDTQCMHSLLESPCNNRRECQTVRGGRGMTTRESSTHPGLRQRVKHAHQVSEKVDVDEMSKPVQGGCSVLAWGDSGCTYLASPSSTGPSKGG